MALNPLNTPYTAFSIPFYIFDLRNQQMITADHIPSDIADTKSIVLTETPIAGLNYDPIQGGGFGNRKISFTLPLIKKNNTVGNIILVKQFEALRNTPSGMKDLFSGNVQFGGSNKVIFHWGTSNSVPLEWYVKKCDYNHKSNFTNKFGHTQYSEVSMELWLDETSALYKAEEMFRKVNAFTSQIQEAFNIPRRIGV